MRTLILIVLVLGIFRTGIALGTNCVTSAPTGSACSAGYCWTVSFCQDATVAYPGSTSSQNTFGLTENNNNIQITGVQTNLQNGFLRLTPGTLSVGGTTLSCGTCSKSNPGAGACGGLAGTHALWCPKLPTQATDYIYGIDIPNMGALIQPIVSDETQPINAAALVCPPNAVTSAANFIFTQWGSAAFSNDISQSTQGSFGTLTWDISTSPPHLKGDFHSLGRITSSGLGAAVVSGLDFTATACSGGVATITGAAGTDTQGKVYFVSEQCTSPGFYTSDGSVCCYNGLKGDGTSCASNDTSMVPTRDVRFYALLYHTEANHILWAVNQEKINNTAAGQTAYASDFAGRYVGFRYDKLGGQTSVTPTTLTFNSTLSQGAGSPLATSDASLQTPVTSSTGKLVLRVSANGTTGSSGAGCTSGDTFSGLDCGGSYPGLLCGWLADENTAANYNNGCGDRVICAVKNAVSGQQSLFCVAKPPNNSTYNVASPYNLVLTRAPTAVAVGSNSTPGPTYALMPFGGCVGGGACTTTDPLTGATQYYPYLTTTITATNAMAEALGAVQQPDRKIVVVGSANSTGELRGPRYGTVVTSVNPFIARYNPDGSLDTAGFANAQTQKGVYTANMSSSTNFNRFEAVAVNDTTATPQGLVAAGTVNTTGTNYDFLVARFKSDGTLDTTSFRSGGASATGNPGYYWLDFGTNGTGTNDLAHSVMVQPWDKKIVVVGEVGDNSKINGTAGFSISKYSYAMGLARFNTDGSLDAAFGTSGKTTWTYSAMSANTAFYSTAAFAATLDSNGNIVAVGRAQMAASSNATAVAANSAAASSGPYYAWVVARFTSAGALDTANFNNPNGYATLTLDKATLNNRQNAAMSVAIDTAGKIYVGGHFGSNTSISAYTSNKMQAALARYTSAGALDTTFGDSSKGYIAYDNHAGTAGHVATNFSDWAPGMVSVRSLYVEPLTGQIVAGIGNPTGYSDQGIAAIVRFTTAGTLDSTFCPGTFAAGGTAGGCEQVGGAAANSGINGYSTFSNSGFDVIGQVLRLYDGSILAVGRDGTGTNGFNGGKASLVRIGK